MNNLLESIFGTLHMNSNLAWVLCHNIDILGSMSKDLEIKMRLHDRILHKNVIYCE